MGFSFVDRTNEYRGLVKGCVDSESIMNTRAKLYVPFDGENRRFLLVANNNAGGMKEIRSYDEINRDTPGIL